MERGRGAFGPSRTGLVWYKFTYAGMRHASVQSPLIGGCFGE